MGATDVSEVVKMSPNLKFLDLSENPKVYTNSSTEVKEGRFVQQAGMLHTLEMLSSITPKVETLMPPLLFNEKMTTNHQFGSVIELDISNQNLGDSFVSNVLQYFVMPNIKVLKYDDNRLTNRGLSDIFAIEGLK